ncbi:hypothetical protein ES705_17232 [subsurface metagenome]
MFRRNVRFELDDIKSCNKIGCSEKLDIFAEVIIIFYLVQYLCFFRYILSC